MDDDDIVREIRPSLVMLIALPLAGAFVALLGARVADEPGFALVHAQRPDRRRDDRRSAARDAIRIGRQAIDFPVGGSARERFAVADIVGIDRRDDLHGRKIVLRLRDGGEFVSEPSLDGSQARVLRILREQLATSA